MQTLSPHHMDTWPALESQTVAVAVGAEQTVAVGAEQRKCA